MSRVRSLHAGVAVLSLLFISGCTQSTDALDTAQNKPHNQVAEIAPTNIGSVAAQQDAAGEKPETAANAEKSIENSGAKIVRQASSLSKKGTNIKVLVNNSPVTNYDIQRRVAFFKLRRIGGNRTTQATEELIDERLKMQEAAIQRTVATTDSVNKAYNDFAGRNKLSGAQMGQVLSRAGVTTKHFKDFLKVQISWQGTVGTKFRSTTQGLSQSDALFSIRKSGGAKPETREFKLQQVIFVVPEANRKKLLRVRAAEAKAFAQRFVNCGETLNQAKQLRDVAIRDLGRVMEPELPPRWKDEVLKTAEGKPTRTKDTERGVEFLAVCSIRNVSDDRAAQLVTQSKEFDSLQAKGNKVADDYLKELRSKATIVYR